MGSEDGRVRPDLPDQPFVLGTLRCGTHAKDCTYYVPLSETSVRVVGRCFEDRHILFLLVAWWRDPSFPVNGRGRRSTYC